MSAAENMHAPVSRASQVEAHEVGAGEVPPHDLDAEAAVLSSVLLDGETALARIVDFLLPEHFYSEAHRRVYEAAVRVRASGAAVDERTVTSWLKETKRLAQVGGVQYVAETLLGASRSAQNIRDHAVVVYERWRARQILAVCRRAAIEIIGGVPDVQPFADNVTRAMAEISRSAPGAKHETNLETLIRTVKQLHEVERTVDDGKPRGIPYGIRDLDDKTLGLHAGQKITIVAPPRVGKTAFALQTAITVAKQGIGVAFFSTEMMRDEIADRQLAYLANVDSKRIRMAKQKRTLTADEWNRISFVMSDMAAINYALRIYDDSSPTVEQICARVKAQAEQSVAVDGVPLGLVVVDYVQKLRPSPGFEHKKKYEQVSHATETLKNLAKDLKIPVIELAQEKNKEVDRAKGQRQRPSLGEAAESFQIERSADVVFYLWRPEERVSRRVKLLIVKQRGLEEADIDLTFEARYSRFTEEGPGGPMTSPSRQYVDTTPEPPDDDGSETLTGGLS